MSDDTVIDLQRPTEGRRRLHQDGKRQDQPKGWLQELLRCSS